MTRGKDESVGSKRAVSGARGCNATSFEVESLDLRFNRSHADHLLQAPSVGGRRRGQELEAVVREIAESRRVRHRSRAGLSQRRGPASIEVGERRRHRQVRDRHVLGKRVDAVQLLQRLRSRRSVVIAHLGHPDHGHPPTRQRAQLTACHRGRHQVRGPGQPMDVGVKATVLPTALELEAALLEREVDRLDRGVQLRGDANGVEAEPGERVMRLRPQYRIEVVDDFHAARVERRGARGARHHRHVSTCTPCCQRCAVARKAPADDDDACQSLTIRRVSATSRCNCSTSSSVLANLMSACR